MPPTKENPMAFDNISHQLHHHDIHTPAIKASNVSEGLFLLEDLGTRTYLDALVEADADADTLYHRAIDTLIKIQGVATDGLAHYDQVLLLEEMHLYTDWYCQIHLKKNLSVAERKAIQQSYHFLAKSALEQPQVFVHRDYHSRNLMVCADESVGVLDYQDAVIGALSYDLVSLLKDCYIEWPEAQRKQWIAYYLAQVNTPFDIDQAMFIRWFDLMGIQRHLKAAGIFARLYHRDGKATYLASIPRTLGYVSETAPCYPELADLAEIVGRLSP